MKSFRRFAFISTLFTYLVIFTGGLVRVSGAGLGCPDWPRCFGRWIPPLSYGQVPSGFDPVQVNLVLAWIEYLNRLLGVILGLLIAITAVLAIRHFAKVPRIMLPAIAAALLVAFQGWQGGQVVAAHLEPLLVSIHLVVSLVILSLLTYVTQEAHYVAYPDAESESSYPRAARFWLALLWLAAVVQIILGTDVRGNLEDLALAFPLDSDLELLGKLGAIKYVHPLLGAIVALLTWVFGFRLLARSRATALVRQGTWWIMLLMLLQLALGLGLIGIGTPALLQLFHLWVAALFIGAVLMLYSATRREPAG